MYSRRVLGFAARLLEFGLTVLCVVWVVLMSLSVGLSFSRLLPFYYRLLDAILDICGCPPEKFRSICSAIDKLDKMEWAEVSFSRLCGIYLYVEHTECGSFDY